MLVVLFHIDDTVRAPQIKIPSILYFREEQHTVSTGFPQSGNLRYTEEGMRQRPWLVLVGGFGGLLLLMAIGGTAALLAIRDLRTSNARAQQHFLSRSRALERIRILVSLHMPTNSVITRGM